MCVVWGGRVCRCAGLTPPHPPTAVPVSNKTPACPVLSLSCLSMCGAKSKEVCMQFFYVSEGRNVKAQAQSRLLTTS